MLGNLGRTLHGNSRIFTVYGGFFGPFIYPDGLAEAPVPVTGSSSARSYGLFQFEELLCVRDGRLTGEVGTLYRVASRPPAGWGP